MQFSQLEKTLILNALQNANFGKLHTNEHGDYFFRVGEDCYMIDIFPSWDYQFWVYYEKKSLNTPLEFTNNRSFLKCTKSIDEAIDLIEYHLENKKLPYEVDIVVQDVKEHDELIEPEICCKIC